MARIGIYAGTFDPVHDGHILFALAAAKQADLGKVVLLPERQPRGKAGVTNFANRVAMLELAGEKHPLLEILELPEPQFLVDVTLPKLQQRFGRDLAMLLGCDVARGFGSGWPGLQTLLDEVLLVVGLRQGSSQAQIENLLAKAGAQNYLCIDSPKDNVASSALRQSGKPNDLDPGVQAYIAAKRLYGLAPAAN